MNSYIVLDGKRYTSVHQQWKPTNRRPMMVRTLLSGNLDITYAESFTTGWQGFIRVPTSETDPWGDIADLRLTIDKKASISYTDHYGNIYTVIVEGDVTEESITPMWDAASNRFMIPISLLKVS